MPVTADPSFAPSSTASPAGAQAITLPDSMLTIAVPTLVLWAMEDPALLPGLLDGLPGWVPQLQLRQVEKASHWIVHEHPERVALELQRSLQ